jgi:SAM-dependent methyltransferase
MRESDDAQRASTAPTGEGAQRQVAYDERAFFESFYSASVRGAVEDRMTIGPITELEARYHYNAAENAIISALVRRDAPPKGGMVRAWRMLRQRKRLRHLDVGSGTGHWVDFFRDVVVCSEAVAVEITTKMADFLREKYAEQAVTVLEADVTAAPFGPEQIGGPVQFISAIGVMFHLVDDAKWQQALSHLAACLAPGGLMFIGGDFGAETRNVQFHRSDDFKNWRDFDRAEGVEGEVRVNKRVRSLAQWTAAASAAGLSVVDLVRTPRLPQITTPENDLLVLARS